MPSTWLLIVLNCVNSRGIMRGRLVMLAASSVSLCELLGSKKATSMPMAFAVESFGMSCAKMVLSHGHLPIS